MDYSVVERVTVTLIIIIESRLDKTNKCNINDNDNTIANLTCVSTTVSLFILSKEPLVHNLVIRCTERSAALQRQCAAVQFTRAF